MDSDMTLEQSLFWHSLESSSLDSNAQTDTVPIPTVFWHKHLATQLPNKLKKNDLASQAADQFS
jgi:hypothetical protein